MGKVFDFDLREFNAFFGRMKQAAQGDFKKELTLFAEGLGFDFLRILQDEIIRRKVVDTRLLLESFHNGNLENIWEITDGGLAITVGTNLDYASYANDGHWTCEKGETQRFVPGTWQGDKFMYDPNAKTGMVLKQKWVEGGHFWESAIRIMEKILPDILEAKMQKWLDTYFKDFI